MAERNWSLCYQRGPRAQRPVCEAIIVVFCPIADGNRAASPPLLKHPRRPALQTRVPDEGKAGTCVVRQAHHALSSPKGGTRRAETWPACQWTRAIWRSSDGAACRHANGPRVTPAKASILMLDPGLRRG